ncbi:hypothetical protein AUP68_12369 [Ilyonectria robusta]
MASFRLSLCVVFFVWAMGIYAAPAIHRHRALHAQLMHRHHAKPEVPASAPHVLFEEQEQPSARAIPESFDGSAGQSHDAEDGHDYRGFVYTVTQIMGIPRND